MFSRIKKILSLLYNYYKIREYRKKVSKIHSATQSHHLKLSGDLVRKHRALWKPVHNPVNTKWLQMYQHISGVQDFRYIPEDIYYTFIEPCLNHKAYSKSYSNKNTYDLFYTPDIFPFVYLRHMNWVFFTRDYQHIKINSDDDLFNLLKEHDRIIVKLAVDGGGGYGVMLFRNQGDHFSSGNHKLTLDFLQKTFPEDDFIIQEYIEQHPFFSRFNESSLNTLRIFTYRSVLTEDIHILHSLLRVGKPGSITDNQASGGFTIGMDSYGRLNGFAINKTGEKITTIGNVDLNQQLQIPLFDQICHLSKDLARQNHYSRLLGLDICITRNNEIKAIEINNVNNEINFYQMNNGPLFGRFTEEIVRYYSKNPISFCFDYMYKP